MGNSPGNLHKYMEAFERHPNCIGGFIWDFVDQGILLRTPDGRPHWGYGGGFGEKEHDGAFIINGIVAPDRSPHPAIHEVKKVYQPISVEAVDLRIGRTRVKNKHAFLSLLHTELISPGSGLRTNRPASPKTGSWMGVSIEPE